MASKHPRLKSFFAALASANRGGVLVTAAIALPILLLLGGGAVDLYRQRAAQSQLQNAVDAAVLGGAAASASGDEAAAQAAFEANAAPGSATGVFDAAAGEVTGSASGQVSTTFLTMIGISSLPIRAEALAITGTSKPCVLMLDPTNPGLIVNSGAELDAQVCSVRVNSAHAQAAQANGGIIRSESLCVRGTVHTGAGGQMIPQARTGCPPLNDPLAGVPEPTIAGPCPNRSAGPGQTVTLAPGCHNNVTANSSGRIVFSPGIHRITGRVEASNAGRISGENVMLYLSTSSAQVVANNSVGLSLSAPTSGPYAGIALFQTRTAANAHPNGLIVNSSVSGKLEGVIYMSHTNMVLNSDVGINAAYTILIGKTLSLNGASKLVLKDRYDGPLPLPTALLSVRLEE
jgi:hypothetical protein